MKEYKELKQAIRTNKPKLRDITIQSYLRYFENLHTALTKIQTKSRT